MKKASTKIQPELFFSKRDIDSSKHPDYGLECIACQEYARVGTTIIKFRRVLTECMLCADCVRLLYSKVGPDITLEAIQRGETSLVKWAQNG